jgi:[ribosomal protein S5]-alanine N-acetyltransferase
MNFATERLTIRPLRESDLEDFYEYRSDPQVCEFQGYAPITRENAEKWLAKLKDAEFGRAGAWTQLGVELRSEGKLIGNVSFKPESDDARIVEFGISFSTKYQKKGYAAEALREIFGRLFETRGAHRIFGVADVENAACVRLLEKLNFRREADFRESFWDAGKNEWRDECVYAMLKKDWR